MSRMPSSDRCSVRGIGVAVMRQHVDRLPQLLEPFLVLDAETLLLVDDDQAEILELHILADQPMRADDDVDAALGQPLEDASSVRRRERKRLTTSTVNGYSARAAARRCENAARPGRWSAPGRRPACRCRWT